MILNSCYSHRGGVTVPNLGDTIQIGGIDYLVVHIDNEKNLMYVGKKYWDSAEDVEFDISDKQGYTDSTLHNACKTYYAEMIPDNIKSLLVTTTEGSGCSVFIATINQIENTFDYFNNGQYENRIFYTQTKARSSIEIDTSNIWYTQTYSTPYPTGYTCINSNGYRTAFSSGSTKRHFRPFMALDMSALNVYSQLEIWKSILS